MGSAWFVVWTRTTSFASVLALCVACVGCVAAGPRGSENLLFGDTGLQFLPYAQAGVSAAAISDSLDPPFQVKPDRKDSFPKKFNTDRVSTDTRIQWADKKITRTHQGKFFANLTKGLPLRASGGLTIEQEFEKMEVWGDLIREDVSLEDLSAALLLAKHKTRSPYAMWWEPYHKYFASFLPDRGFFARFFGFLWWSDRSNAWFVISAVKGQEFKLRGSTILDAHVGAKVELTSTSSPNGRAEVEVRRTESGETSLRCTSVMTVACNLARPIWVKESWAGAPGDWEKNFTGATIKWETTRPGPKRFETIPVTCEWIRMLRCIVKLKITGTSADLVQGILGKRLQRNLYNPASDSSSSGFATITADIKAVQDPETCQRMCKAEFEIAVMESNPVASGQICGFGIEDSAATSNMANRLADEVVNKLQGWETGPPEVKKAQEDSDDLPNWWPDKANGTLSETYKLIWGKSLQVQARVTWVFKTVDDLYETVWGARLDHKYAEWPQDRKLSLLYSAIEDLHKVCKEDINATPRFVSKGGDR